MKIVKDVRYSVNFTEQRKLDIFLPDASNGVCLLFIHGGGWEKGNSSQWHTVAEHFCKLGYVCASIGYRLTPEFIYPSQVEDARLAVQYLIRNAVEYDFQPNKLVAIGSSAGGYLAAILATLDEQDELGCTDELSNRNTLPCAVVCYCPVTTLFTDQTFIVSFMGGTSEEKRELYEEASPIYRVKGSEPPFLFIQGDADETTTLVNTSAMCNKINQLGGRAELIVLPGIKHGFGYGVTSSAQQVSLLYISEFLKKYELSDRK